MTFLNRALFRLRTARANQYSVALLLAFALIAGATASVEAPEHDLAPGALARFSTQVGAAHLFNWHTKRSCEEYSSAFCTSSMLNENWCP